jgi:hypothetical protein
MAGNLQKGNPGGRWQDESLVHDDTGRKDDEKASQNSEHIDNPEHMESPDSMANPQSRTDVGRKVGEDSGAGGQPIDNRGNVSTGNSGSAAMRTLLVF